MAATRSVMVGERPVVVKELTVTEVRNWVAELEGRVLDPIRAMVFDDCSLDDLERMSDMPAADMEAYGPGDLAELHAAAKVLNPHFFNVREALISVSRAIQAGIDSLSTTAP
jgi:hypothetical protein